MNVLIQKSKKMEMLGSDGPKYRKQTENTPGKDHPKIGMKYGTTTRWIEVTVLERV